MSYRHQYDLIDMLCGLCAQYNYISKRSGIDFEFIHAGPIYTNHDREELQRILICLLDSAFRFTPQGGIVTLSLSDSENNTIHISVTCNVNALPLICDLTNKREAQNYTEILESNRTELFPSFSYVGRSTKLMQGIFNISETDQGSVLYHISLPLNTECEESGSGTHNEVNRISIDRDANTNDTESGYKEHNKLILILISDSWLSDFVGTALSDSYRIIKASDEAEAKQLINDYIPDFIILENKYKSLINKFRELPFIHKTPSLTLIDSVGESFTSDGISKSWYNGFIRMPVTTKLLKEEVDNLINQPLSMVEYLEESENRYDLLFNNSPEGIIVHNDEKFIFVNKAAIKLFGIKSKKNIKGQSIYEYIPLRYRRKVKNHIRTMQSNNKIRRIKEFEIICKDSGVNIQVEAISMPLVVNNKYYIYTILHDLSERKILEREIIESAAAEQLRIGSEIHDSIGQELTSLNLLLRHLENKYDEEVDPDVFKNLLSHIQQIVHKTIQSSRLIAKGLSPIELEGMDFDRALLKLSQEITHDTNVCCSFNFDGPAIDIDETTALHLYRITQEAINNALKHSDARHINVYLVNDNTKINLCIEDDGVGFDSTNSNKRTGMGLKLMHYRADILGAKLRVISKPDKGCQVICSYMLL